RKDVAIVVGCGPVGLAVVTLLKGRGVRTVVASDPSAGRRALAAACGAAVVGIETVARLPVPWWHTWRALEKVGVTIPKAPVVFECVGIPGMLDQVITGAP